MISRCGRTPCGDVAEKLAVIYREGRCVPKDEAKAEFWESQKPVIYITRGPRKQR